MLWIFVYYFIVVWYISNKIHFFFFNRKFGWSLLFYNRRATHPRRTTDSANACYTYVYERSGISVFRRVTSVSKRFCRPQKHALTLILLSCARPRNFTPRWRVRLSSSYRANRRSFPDHARLTLSIRTQRTKRSLAKFSPPPPHSFRHAKSPRHARRTNATVTYTATHIALHARRIIITADTVR